jgi:hypothetical protein
MELTDKQLVILNHVVEDGQAWADNAKKEAHVLAKIARHESAYDEAVAKGNYKNRATRDEEERVAKLPTPMDTWKQKMVGTDSGMPRIWEDFLTLNGTDGWPQVTKDRHISKVALRATQPEA